MRNAKMIGFVATRKPEAARKFYEKTLGLKFVSEDPFAIVFEVEGRESSNRVASSQESGDGTWSGIMLRVQKVEALTPAGYTVLGWDVADIRSEVEELVKKGVKFERYDFLEQDELGVWSAPSGAKVAWFKDPDGNMLSLTQFR
jgi:catechol 2,3-dioxygenase-like lactoylglutathione lyase family enzyme